MPSDEQLASTGGHGNVVDADAGRIGVALAPLDESTRARFRIAEDVKGALIVDVDSNGPAAREGLRPGDVIVMVGQSRVEQPADVSRNIRSAAKESRKSVLLLVDREGSQRFVTVPLGKA